MPFTKDKTILNLLDHLDLPRRGWEVLDFWEGDLFAVGITSKSRPDHLVYVSTYGKEPAAYDYECEKLLSDDEYETVKAGRTSSRDDLEDVLKQHLDVRDDENAVS